EALEAWVEPECLDTEIHCLRRRVARESLELTQDDLGRDHRHAEVRERPLARPRPDLEDSARARDEGSSRVPAEDAELEWEVFAADQLVGDQALGYRGA